MCYCCRGNSCSKNSAFNTCKSWDEGQWANFHLVHGKLGVKQWHEQERELAKAK